MVEEADLGKHPCVHEMWCYAFMLAFLQHFLWKGCKGRVTGAPVSFCQHYLAHHRRDVPCVVIVSLLSLRTLLLERILRISSFFAPLLLPPSFHGSRGLCQHCLYLCLYLSHAVQYIDCVMLLLLLLLLWIIFACLVILYSITVIC